MVMQTFKLSDSYTVVCNWKKTRNGFKHEAALMQNGLMVFKTKICYLNRTWESFEFESVLRKLVSTYFEGKEQEAFKEKIKTFGGRGNDQLRNMSMVAAMGAIFGKDEKEKNDWKKRFLKLAHGIDFPDDFDSLSEEEKQRRLDGAIAIGLDKSA